MDYVLKDILDIKFVETDPYSAVIFIKPLVDDKFNLINNHLKIIFSIE